LPTLDWQRLLDYRDDSLHSATKKSIARAQAALKLWGDAWTRGERFRPLPKYPESDKAAAFGHLWRQTFAPLHVWLREAALAFGRQTANAYATFRWSEAVMTYDDQVRMALQALEHPSVQRELAAEQLCVLLDEAQDTDPRQFEVLLRVAGIAEALEQPGTQNFSMVGDFQQAIYAPRSDLGIYRGKHDLISMEPRGTQSRLSVTFRCDRAIIDFVNRLFPAVLNNAAGQCEFIPLSPRDNAGPGQVVRWSCPDDLSLPEGEKITAGMRARHEARFVAQRMHALGPAGLGAADCSQVAVLCPRKNWLVEIQRELVALGVPVQLHSSNERQGDRTPGAWLTALLWIAAHPEDSFEVAGVLREVFGVSDHDLALFTERDGDRLRLDRPATEDQGPVAAALQILRDACSQADALPLHQAVRQIIGKTLLRERLNSIPDLALENADRELDDFLALIAGRSADGVTLAELAHELRLGLTQPWPVEEEIQDAVQMMTSHKSKGLEWQTVVVPFVFRTIESKAVPYPRLAQLGNGQEIICRDKHDFAAEARDFVTARERQQLQRLLYVVSTRAKQTLLLVDDESLYAEQKKRSGWSAGELLDLSEENQRAVWLGLPETLSLSAAPSAAPGPAHVTLSLPTLSQRDLEQAVHRAAAIPRRTTPHALAVHAPREAEPEKKLEREEETPSAGSPGILYGTWWHEMIETLPWSQPRSWQKKFDEALPHSPQPARSRREWELFCRSSLAKWLAEPDRLIQIEFPFLWRESDIRCIEGIVDLAVYTATDSSWRVIDWKTNHVGPEGGAGLVQVYRGQILAYVNVLRQMLSAEVRGSLYLTQTGEWVDVDES